MKPFRIFFMYLMVIALSSLVASPALAASKRHEVRGMVMASETNKPVSGAVVSFFGKSDTAIAAKPSEVVSTDKGGVFLANVSAGSYIWTVKAEGQGVFQSGTVFISKPYDVGISYLRKPAELSGRIVDGSGTPVAGVTISADPSTKAVSGADGRFHFVGLDPRGYEPALAKPGRVLEKNEYYYLSPGEKKELGDLVVRTSGSLTVRLSVRENGKPVALHGIRVNLSGTTVYRSLKAGKTGIARLDGLPPGRYSVSAPDERLKEQNIEIELGEGENGNVALETTLKPPTLSIEEYSEVFLPDKPVKLRANSLRVEKADATVSLIAADRVLDGSVDLRKPASIPADSLRKVATLPVPFKTRRDSHTRLGRIPLPGLQPGAYLLELKGSGASTRFAFLVTRLGVVAKVSPAATLLYAADLINGTPLSGVRIASRAGTAAVTTGTDGMAPWSVSKSPTRLTAQSGSNLAFLDLPGKSENGSGDGIKGYIYTDRPAYRPGQTVHYKGVLRRQAGENYRLPGTRTVHVEVKDDNDKAVCVADPTVNANGSFNGDCSLPAVPALGEYGIAVSGSGETWHGSFQVLEYRKPEFEVKAIADRRFLIAGDTGQFKISGRYYFGAPVAGGKLVWRLYAKPAWDAGRAGDDDGPDEGQGFNRGYADFLGEGEVLLDGSGEANIPITAKPCDAPLQYTLEADVTDAASRQVSASGSVTVVPSLVALNIKAANYLTRPGEPQEITVKAATWEGAPLALPLKLSFARQVYDKKNRSYSWQQSEQSNVATAMDGSARTRFIFPGPGYWQIKAEGTDDAGRLSSATTSVWVWKKGHSWEGSYRELEAEFDRRSYQPGDTARLIVRSPLTGGSLLLTLEGREFTGQRVTPLKEMVEVIEIPVTEAQAPYVHVSAVTIGNGRLYSKTLQLKVERQPGKMNLKITPDKPIYAPGDRVSLKLSSRTEGAPLPGELSLAVVDEAIFAIAKERSEDIWQFFRGKRDHLVTTLHSFPRLYLGGASKDRQTAPEADDGLKGLKVRKVFKDTAAWFPLIETQPDGSAQAEFTLPDNLTTWRATAVGHSGSDDFGTGREKFIARLELMARLAPPRFFTVGDELLVPGMVTSMIDAEQKATGRFETQGLTLLGEPGFSGTVAPRGQLRSAARLRADKAGSATLRLMAKGNDKGDAMELTLPVLPRSISREVTGGLALADNETTLAMNLPDDSLPGSASLKLTFSPTIAAGLNGAISRLVEFPYGCVEQTLSRFIPAVHARSLLGKTGWQPDQATRDKLPLAIAEGIRRLEEMQHDDGGWGWWKSDSSGITMTSHAVYGLGLAKRAGVAVPESLLKRGIASLEKLAANAPANDLPRIHRALAVNDITAEPLEQRIMAGWKRLPLTEKLAHAEALAFGDRKEVLTPLVDELKREVQSEGTAAYLKEADSDSWWYGWRFGASAVENTAAMLTLLTRSAPTDPLNARLAAFLARRQTGGWWQTTSGSAAAVTALADYVAASGEAAASYTARLTLNGTDVTTWRVENGTLKAGDSIITIPAVRLATGGNNLKLSKDNGGMAYLAATLDYQAAPEAARSADGLKLERRLYRVSTAKSGSIWRREYTPLAPGESVKPGEDIEVRLTVENRRALEYVIIEDRLPAGFESRETDRDPRFIGEAAYQGWYSNRERRDEKLAFFITTLPAGRHEFRHVLYPEIEGSMLALPAAVWPMYLPELRGESTPWQFVVK
ncbi:MAG TPA: hypothetical protein HPP76_02200 [Desulfuromonadales bacterium]|nr:hypothetical protein [Desulfuromonadales bacterium]